MTRKSLVLGRAVGALVVLAALPGLAACGPAPRALTAIRADGGEPVILLASCPDFQIESISVYTSSRDATASVDGPDRRLERTGPAVPESLPLFGDPPAGWTVADDSLTALAADGLYGLSAYDHNARNTVAIGFTAADLAALGPGEVLIGKVPSSHETVTEKEFRKRAAKGC